eukprot:TRINITY_DN15184_c0_g1_i1.p1 TRINITY_DN15184_c0_g1~~TRINITY_DN15184_c0_g1_i1.p1  ORF type:complete len:403 (+),score=121.61 TRINITY_DN15184_c0_g1_i1:74-1210(+)
MKILFILLAFMAVGIYSQTVQVDLSVSLSVAATSSSSDFRKRNTTARLVSTSLINGALIKSYELTKTNGQSNFDAIRFGIYAINPVLGLGGVAPTATGAYYERESSVSNTTGDKAGIDYDVSSSLNYQAIRLFSLEELDANGNVVKTIGLNSVSWSVKSTNIGNSDSQNDLPRMSLEGSSNGINMQVYYIATSSYGYLSVTGYSNLLLPPKGLEIIFYADLSGYTYANSNNRLRLVTYTVTGSASRSANVSSSVTNIPKRVASYITTTLNGVSSGVRFDGSIAYNGNQVSVNANLTVQTPSLSSIFSGVDAALQISAILGANAQVTRTDVAFPVNANGKVIYDPQMYFGSDVNTQSANSSVTFVISFILMALLFVLQF